MPIAACYTMDLYCDCVDCAECTSYCTPVTQYHGETWGECATQARKNGWQISRDRTTCFAPGHKRIKAVENPS